MFATINTLSLLTVFAQPELMSEFQKVGCSGCKDGTDLDFSFAMAFQPIIDLQNWSIYAYEALVRGSEGQSAASVLGRVSETNRYAFDQQCRVKAIETATRAGILDSGAKLSINFLPNAVYSPAACIQLTLKTAKATSFPSERLMFEITENEEVVDPEHVAGIVEAYRQMGFLTALDDFGAGYAGLNLLARFQPDIIKIDMELTRAIHSSKPRQAIVHGLIQTCTALGIDVIAEGIETAEELSTLSTMGVRYVQGYYFAKPAFERLPPINVCVH